MSEIPTVVWILVAVLTATTALVLIDLARHEVRHLPKWAWAAIIVASNFPLGYLLYVLVGRDPDPPVHATSPLPPPRTATPGRVSLPVDVSGPPAATLPPHRPVLTTHALSKVYGDTTVLHDIHLDVPEGGIYGLIGPNGAGKTTMLSIIAGLRRASSGRVEVAVPRTRLGVLVDTPQFEPWLTAREVVDLARHLTAPEQPRARVDEVLVEVGLGDVRQRRTGGFSRGMLQRLGLATCLVGDPALLLLDEPSSALDPAGRREVLDLIGRLAGHTTVMLSTHILGDVQQVCDTVGVLDGGRLRYQGSVADLLAHTASAYALQVRAPVNGLVDALRRAEWATEVIEQAPGRLRLVVHDAGLAERDVPRIVADHGLPLVAFAPATDLETAFLELTGGRS